MIAVAKTDLCANADKGKGGVVEQRYWIDGESKQENSLE